MTLKHMIILSLSADLSLNTGHAQTYAIGISKQGLTLTDKANGRSTSWKKALLVQNKTVIPKTSTQAPAANISQPPNAVKSQVPQTSGLLSEQQLSQAAQTYLRDDLKLKRDQSLNCYAQTVFRDGMSHTYCFNTVATKQTPFKGDTTYVYLLTEGKLPDGFGAVQDPGIAIMTRFTYTLGDSNAKSISLHHQVGYMGNADLANNARMYEIGPDHFGWVIASNFQDEYRFEIFGVVDNKIVSLGEVNFSKLEEDQITPDHASDEMIFNGMDKTTLNQGLYALKFTHHHLIRSKNKQLRKTTQKIIYPFDAKSQRYLIR